jgi:ubiquinone/menaquinone biosynthesis C-methylase UbiE
MVARFRRDARLEKPRALLPGLLNNPTGIWVDAASGDGVFAETLIEQSPSTITVIGLDLRLSAAQRFRNAVCRVVNNGVALQADLSSPLPVRSVDGILVANGLHFFQEKQQAEILRNFARALKDGGSLIIVEYNTARPTAAVPFPIPIQSMDRLLITSGFEHVQNTSRVRSSYLGEMYAVLTNKRSPERSSRA